MIDVSMKSLRAKFGAQDQLVTQAAQIWGVHPESSDLLKTVLAHMQSPFAARGIWQQLDDRERRVLFEALSSKDRGRGVAAALVQKKAKVSGEAFEVALRRLSEHWFLLEVGEIPGKSTKIGPAPLPDPVRAVFPYREPSETLYHTGRELFVPSEKDPQQPLRRVLRLLSSEALEHLARLCHVAVTSGLDRYMNRAPSLSSHPFEVHEKIAEAMVNPAITFELLHQLNLPSQALFLWLCQQGGKASMADVQRYLVTQGPGANDHVFAILQSLETHALAFDALLPGGGREVFVAQDLFDAVQSDARDRSADEQQHALVPILSAPDTIRDSGPVILYDIAAIVGCVYQQVIVPTKDGKIPKRLTTKIRPLLQGLPRNRDMQEDVYTDQLFAATKDLGLLRCDAPYEGEKPRYIPGAGLTKWRQENVVCQMRQFLQWWLHSSTWYDVHPGGKILYPSASRGDSGKRKLLSLLTHCLPGHSYRVEAFLFSLWRQAPLYLYDPYTKQSERVSLREQRARWIRQGEGFLYLGWLSSFLSELGIVTLGYEHPTPGQEALPDLFCLTPLGSAAISDPLPVSENGELPLLSSGGKMLIVQPSFEVLIFVFDPAIIYQIAKFAQIKRIGAISTFTLTQAALLRGLETGLRVEEILAFLTTHGQRELPQNIVYSLSDWSRSYREVRLAQVLLLELEPPQAENELYRVLREMHIEPRKLAPGVFTIDTSRNAYPDLHRRLEKERIVVRWTPPPQPRSRW